jgi:tetratricopeptide (TPR) repeat protein
VLERALDLGGDEAEVTAQAARFLGDIELSVRGDRERAGALLTGALEAARALGDPWTLARTLLVAGWGPYWRDDTDGARRMFEEALETARSNPAGDPWAEARALVACAMLTGEEADEEDALALASEALAIAEAAGDRFSIGVAREAVAGPLRRMLRLEAAEVHAAEAVEAFRALGARWELASALTSMGIVRRLARRTPEAVADLREARRLCVELKEQSIIRWTSASLAKALLDADDPGAARRVLDESGATAGSAALTEWPVAHAELLLVEGDREGALEQAAEILRAQLEGGHGKDVAAQIWWIAELFGPEAAGGAGEVRRAREVIESTHYLQAVREAELVLEREARRRLA